MRKPFVIEAEPSRVTYETAHWTFLKKKEQQMAEDVTKLLEKEQRRLMRTWHKD